MRLTYNNRISKNNKFIIHFRKKNWVKINDDARGTFNTNGQIKFKSSILKSSLFDYSNAYIPVSETITVA